MKSISDQAHAFNTINRTVGLKQKANNTDLIFFAPSIPFSSTTAKIAQREFSNANPPVVDRFFISKVIENIAVTIRRRSESSCEEEGRSISHDQKRRGRCLSYELRAFSHRLACLATSFRSFQSNEANKTEWAARCKAESTIALYGGLLCNNKFTNSYAILCEGASDIFLIIARPAESDCMAENCGSAIRQLQLGRVTNLQPYFTAEEGRTQSLRICYLVEGMGYYPAALWEVGRSNWLRAFFNYGELFFYDPSPPVLARKMEPFDGLNVLLQTSRIEKSAKKNDRNVLAFDTTVISFPRRDAAVAERHVPAIQRSLREVQRRPVYALWDAEPRIILILGVNSSDKFYPSYCSVNHGDKLVAESNSTRNSLNPRRLHDWSNVYPKAFSPESSSACSEKKTDVTSNYIPEERDFEFELLPEVVLESLNGAAFRMNCNDKFRFDYISKGCQKIFGYSPRELASKEMVIVPADMPLFFNAVSSCKCDNESIDHTFRIQHKSGEIRWARLRGKGVFQEKKKLQAIEGWLVDVSELQESKARLRQSENLASAGKMICTIAHECRNALQRIQVATDLLELKLGPNKDTEDELRIINLAQSEVQQLFDDFEAFSKPIELRPESADLSEIWRQSWEQLEIARTGRNALIIEQVSNTNTNVFVDKFRCRQVFRNLFENSLAACKGTVRITLCCRDTLISDEHALRITVGDNGTGINKARRGRVFDDFYTTKDKGSGLGMAIAKQIVEAHGGSISIAETKQKGAVIEILLPRTVCV